MVVVCVLIMVTQARASPLPLFSKHTCTLSPFFILNDTYASRGAIHYSFLLERWVFILLSMTTTSTRDMHDREC